MERPPINAHDFRNLLIRALRTSFLYSGQMHVDGATSGAFAVDFNCACTAYGSITRPDAIGRHMLSYLDEWRERISNWL